MRILIIGGTRFSGPHVVRRLVNLGHEIVLFHRGKTEADLPDNIRHILGTRNHIRDFAEILTRFAPQIVLDMIATTERHAFDVVDIFTGVAQRAVAISSQDVYRAYGKLIGIETGPLQPMPLTEVSPLRQTYYPYRERVDPGHRLYHYEKILVEQAYMNTPDLPGTILRYPMVYGPRDPQHRWFPYLKRMDDHRPAIVLTQGMANWHWTRGYVENVAEAVVLAVIDKRAMGQVYNIGEKQTRSEAEWVNALGAAAGWHGEVITVPENFMPEHLRPDINTAQHLIADTERLREELGYTEPVFRDEALRRTVAWERDHPPTEIAPQAFNYAVEDALLTNLKGQKDIDLNAK